MTKRILISLGLAAMIAGYIPTAGAYVLLPYRFGAPERPIPYHFNTLIDEECVPGNIEFDEWRIAIQEWANYGDVTMTWVEAPDTPLCGNQNDDINIFSFNDCTGSCAPPCLAVTTSYLYNDPVWVGDHQIDMIREADITFSAAFPFGSLDQVANGCDGCPGGANVDLRGVAVHEVGHWFGIGHSGVGASTMAPTVSLCDTSNSKLHQDDITAIQLSWPVGFQEFDTVDLEGGNCATSLMNAGEWGLSGLGRNLGVGAYGRGFEYPKGTNNLFEASVMFGQGPVNPVSDDVRSDDTGGFGSDNDFLQQTEVMFTDNGTSQSATATFSDDKAESPYGIQVTQTMHVFADAPNDDFAISCYTIQNNSDFPIPGLRVGFWQDWDHAGGIVTNSVTWDFANEIGIISEASSNVLVGIKVLSAEGANGFRANTTDLTGQGVAASYNDSDKAAYLFSGFTQTTVANDDIHAMVTTGDFNLLPGGTAQAAFAVIGGDDMADLLANAAAAQAVYDAGGLCTEVVAVEDPNVSTKPRAHLAQNVPNPFRPSTRIPFELERARMVSLRVFDLSGRKVRTLVEGVRLPGAHEVTWDATDDAGRSVPAGMYFYTLAAGGQSVTKKMSILR